MTAQQSSVRDAIYWKNAYPRIVIFAFDSGLSLVHARKHAQEMIRCYASLDEIGTHIPLLPKRTPPPKMSTPPDIFELFKDTRFDVFEGDYPDTLVDKVLCKAGADPVEIRAEGEHAFAVMPGIPEEPSPRAAGFSCRIAVHELAFFGPEEASDANGGNVKPRAVIVASFALQRARSV